MTHEIIPHPVIFSSLENQEAMRERRHGALALAQAAARIKELQELAFKDPLTGLPNRLALETEFPRLLDIAEKRGEPMAVAMLDVRGLKRANDLRGHEEGDKLLRSVSVACEDLLRSDDVLFRWGGDEFVVVLPGFNGEPERYKERIKDNFGRATQHAGIPDELHVGISLGLAEFQHGDTLDAIVKRADEALKIDHDSTYLSLSEQGIEFHDPRLQA